jgi:hypothetical protein
MSNPNVPSTRIVFLNRDLFAGIGIVNTIRALGFEPTRVSDLGDFQTAMSDQSPTPALGIIDMNNEIDWEAVSLLTSSPDCPPVIAFGPHVDVEGRRAAKKAGLTRILSNGEFSKDMANIITRYANAADIRHDATS